MRVIFGFLTQREMVTNADAVIGRRDSGDFQVVIASVKLIRMNRTGQMGDLAHLCLPCCMKISSRKIPTKFGMAPPYALSAM